jgi:hypothetical protein
MRTRCVLSIALKLLVRVRKKFVRALIEIRVAVLQASAWHAIRWRS